MLTTQRRRLMTLFGAKPQPRPELETVPLKLSARVVARRVRDYLDGRWTRGQLGDWAIGQYVRQDFSHWFDPQQASLLREALGSLILVDQAGDAARDRVILEALAERLEAQP